MKSGKLKRNFWLTAEIECMLNLIKEVKLAQGAIPTSTTHHTFTQIASKMKNHGFPNKSPTQVRRKWFQMKSAYLCYKKGNVDRLFLIPERFRNVIAQFVESGSKIRRASTATPPRPAIQQQQPPRPAIQKQAPRAAIQQQPPPKATIETPQKTTPPRPTPPPRPTSPPPPPPAPQPAVERKLTPKPPAVSMSAMDMFMAEVKQSNKLMNAQFNKWEFALVNYEQRCQTIRDNNLIKYMSS